MPTAIRRSRRCSPWAPSRRYCQSAAQRHSGTAAKGEEKLIDGVPAIGLTGSGAPGAILYIATTGEPYPLRLTIPEGAGLVYSSVGEPITDIKPPAAGTVVDLNKVHK